MIPLQGLSLVSEVGLPLSLSENLTWRDKQLTRADKDLGLRKELRLCSMHDTVFFFNAFLWTYDDRTPLKHLPFLTYEYQIEYIQLIEDHIVRGEDLLTEKARDMGATEIVLGVFLKRWLFNGDSFLTGSRIEKYIDEKGNMQTHFERLRYKLGFIPYWMLPVGFDARLHSGYMKLVNPESKNAIIGEAMTKDFSRQGRFKAELLDEFAFADDPEATWRATADSTPCRLPVSTANGEDNYFFQLRDGGSIKVHTLDWKKHPKKTPQWYEGEKLRRRAEDLAREVDIDYKIAGAERKIIKPMWIESCRANTANLGPAVRLTICDIARDGDDEIVIDTMDGYRCEEQEVVPPGAPEHKDTMKLAGLLRDKRRRDKTKCIVVELVGIGAGVFDRLVEMGEPCVGINPGEQASDPAKWVNLRAEIWWTASEIFRESLATPPDDQECRRQLGAPSYRVTDSGGRIAIEKKEDIKKRIRKSTDRGDTYVIGLWAVKAAAILEIIEQHAGTPEQITGEQAGLMERVEIGQAC